MKRSVCRATERARLLSTGLFVLFCWAYGAEAQPSKTVRCDATRDVWLSAMDGETDFNMGGASTLKLKLWQEFALVDFDVDAVRGHHIQKATLDFKPAGGHRIGLNGGSDLRWLPVSTVTHDWVEGLSRDYGTDRRGRGATFNESSYGSRNWGWEGARVWDVILGNGNSLRDDGRLNATEDGWLSMEIDPRLVASLVTGTSHGLALMDGSTAVFVNSFIKSRESGRGPYLEVELGARDVDPPPLPTDVVMVPYFGMATTTLGASWLSVQVAPETFAIDLWIDGESVDRWQLPAPPASGGPLSFPLVGLQPDRELRMEIAAIDSAGNRSSRLEFQSRSSSRVSTPELRSVKPVQEAEVLDVADAPEVWALPAVSKLDSLTHRLIDEPTPPGLKIRNAVWDGDTGTVSLIAARGEIVGFQIVIEVAENSCQFRLSGLSGPTEIPGHHARVWRNWQVEQVPELAIPVTGFFELPAGDNALVGQRSQSFTIDYFIPGDSAPGNYTGTLSLDCHVGQPRMIDLRVRVFDVVIPDRVGFNIELNTYGGPGAAGSQRFIASQRLAHYHRATINRVPYSQKGRIHDDWIPDIARDGSVVSWKRFDRNLGGMLDGSWFVDNPRGPIPAPVLYLPLFEGWPIDYRSVYQPGVSVPDSAANPMAMLRHDVLALPIEDSLPDSFERTFKRVVRDFAQHIAAKKWNETQFQVYLNNKPRFHYSLWSFDEPFKLLDWRRSRSRALCRFRQQEPTARHRRSVNRTLDCFSR